MVVRVFLILECESAVAHMIEVLQPLKEGHRHATRITVQIWDYKHIVFQEDFFSLCRGGAISSLCYDLCLHLQNEHRKIEHQH